MHQEVKISDPVIEALQDVIKNSEFSTDTIFLQRGSAKHLPLGGALWGKDSKMVAEWIC